MQKFNVEPHTLTSHNESYDDGESDWSAPNSIDLYDLASAAGRLAGNLNNRPGALDDFFNKLKLLEQEWYEAEKRYNRLKIENDRINNQLIHEKTRCAMYQKKLKFIQDNQKNFEKLKEVYLAMKHQESATRIARDIREQESQTADFVRPHESKSTLTSSISVCDKHVLTKYYGNVMQTDSMISIRRTELADAHENLQLLKDMIKRREYTWSMNMQREESMIDEIKMLKEDRQTLEALVRVKDIELTALKSMKSINPNHQEENINNMKRIIGKLSKRLKELEKVGRVGRYSGILSEKEMDLVHEIVDRESLPKRPQMLKPQPPKISTNRSFPGPSAAKSTKGGLIKSPLSTIIENKAKSVSDSSEEYDAEMHELEILGQIKKSIEVKQAALKEKVQQIINYSEQRGVESK